MGKSFEDYLLDNFANDLGSLTSLEIASLKKAFDECQSWIVAEQMCLKKGLSSSDIDFTNDFEKISQKRLEAQTKLNTLARSVYKRENDVNLTSGFSR